MDSRTKKLIGLAGAVTVTVAGKACYDNISMYGSLEDSVTAGVTIGSEVGNYAHFGLNTFFAPLEFKINFGTSLDYTPYTTHEYKETTLLGGWKLTTFTESDFRFPDDSGPIRYNKSFRLEK